MNPFLEAVLDTVVPKVAVSGATQARFSEREFVNLMHSLVSEEGLVRKRFSRDAMVLGLPGRTVGEAAQAINYFFGKPPRICTGATNPVSVACGRPTVPWR